MRKTSLHMNAPDFHVHSTFSTLDGMGSPESVVRRAVELEWGAVALTEHGWIGSAPIFYKMCLSKEWSDKTPKPQIKPILGCELYVVHDDILGKHDKEYRSASRHLTVLALTREGYQNLVTWNNISMQRENYYHRPRISLDCMIDSAPWPLHHNVVLSGCIGSELCQNLLHMNGGSDLAAGEAYIYAMRSVFPHFYVELQRHEHPKFLEFDAFADLVAQERIVREKLIRLAYATMTPMVLTNDSHYQSSAQRKAHIAMLASKGWKAKDESHRTEGTAQTQMSSYLEHYGYWTNYMQSMEDLAAKLDEPDLAAECLYNMQEIAHEADIRLDPLDSFSYSIPSSGYSDRIAEIRERCKPRLKELIAKHGDLAKERFEIELAAMGDFADYLLLMSNFLIAAAEQGILTSTRGSAANSLLCYCLRIHNIDSIEYKLTFSRFVNPARKKFPDIDIDIQSQRREDFMRFVFETMIPLEGEGQVLPICTYGTMANRATFRMVAEALGMSQEKQDEIAKLLPQMIDSGMVSEENDVFEGLKSEYPELYDLASKVFDSVKQVSQHACGYIFGTRDRPLERWIPQMLLASSGATVTQYNYPSSEMFGLVKMDFLKLDTLDIANRIYQLIGRPVEDFWTIPLDDEPTYEMLREGRTVGIHSLQGKTQRRGCMEIGVKEIEDIVLVQALYRPSGTRKGGSETVVRRRNEEEEVTYPSAITEPHLAETYGVLVYQEQVMEIAYAIGMTDAEVQQVLDAIKLAKGMGRGAREAFERLHPMFMRYALKHMTDAEAEMTLADWEAFQGYGFNRGHAASYALLAYRMAYLKCHYPAEFFVSLLSSYPDRPEYIAGAKSEGFGFEPPDVNKSGGTWALGDKKNTLKIGLQMVKGIADAGVNEIVRHQPFSSVQDMLERCHGSRVNQGTVKALQPIGGLQSLGVRGDDDDLTELRLLGLCLHKPQAMKDIKPKLPPRGDGSWRHLGLVKGVDVTAGKALCSKLFWIPPLEDKELLRFEATPWALAKTYLLKAVDENGIVFELAANEQKTYDANLVKFLARTCKGAVICAEGQVAKPFLREDPPGFKIWGVTGAEIGKPQAWHLDDLLMKALIELAMRKKFKRKEA